MSKRNYTREKVADSCFACTHDCKQVILEIPCDNFVKGYTRKQYLRMLDEENVNLKSLCEKKKLSLNFMYKMLSGNMHMKYKYRMALNSRLGELDDYLPYVDKFNCEVSG